MEVVKFADGFGPNERKRYHEYKNGYRAYFDVEFGFDKHDPNTELHLKWLIDPGPRYEEDNYLVYELNNSANP